MIDQITRRLARTKKSLSQLVALPDDEFLVNHMLSVLDYVRNHNFDLRPGSTNVPYCSYPECNSGITSPTDLLIHDRAAYHLECGRKAISESLTGNTKMVLPEVVPYMKRLIDFMNSSDIETRLEGAYLAAQKIHASEHTHPRTTHSDRLPKILSA
jgi:hypothetical protein